MSEARLTPERPFVTLSYAQSLDGSIARYTGEKVMLSNNEALSMTHQLRASHDALLIGIGTVLSDDPQLTVRFAEGENPQPVILDGHLKIPLSSKLLNRADKKPWIFTRPLVDMAYRSALEKNGCRVIPVKMDRDDRLDLKSVLSVLQEYGIRKLMVEGGANVIASFMEAGLVDQVVVTVSPVILGGLNPYINIQKLYSLSNVELKILREDVVISGKPNWREE